MENITPCLWFDKQAEDAANFYVATIKNSKITAVTRYPSDGPMPKGTVLTVSFELNGQPFMALNGGPLFQFSEAISFVIECDDQAEVDRYWDALNKDGGTESQCGWLKDKFGLSWQIVPKGFVEMMTDPDSARVARAFKAMMPMKKLDLATILAAADG